MRLGFLFAACVFSSTATVGATVYVDDPLTASTFAGRGSKGGAFGPSGWTTSNEPDAIWYEISDAIATGQIEYTVTGLAVGGTLSGTDHDILTFYQAPSGVAEPIAYSPYFRNNDFKAFTRIFGSGEPGRGGAMKLELAFCPRGDPWYHDAACTPECDGSGIAYARGSPKDVGWDPSKSYRMIMSWEPGKIGFMRDGEALGSLAFKGTYAAKPLRVRFGSPRHDGVYPGAAFMPKGLVFKDVKITGTAGTMTPVCGSSTTDAGPDATTSDAVVDSGSASIEVAALQDVTGASFETGVFSDPKDLNPEGDGKSSRAVAYLKFPPVTGVPTRVVLRLRTHGFPSATGGSGVVCLVDDDSWSESTLTWATRPPISTTCVGVPRTVDPDVDVDWDVTPLFAKASSANRNFAIVSTDADGVHYQSKEASAARGPRLLITPGPAVPDAGVDAAGDAAMDGGIDASRGDAPGEAGAMDDGTLEGRCECGVVGATPARASGFCAFLVLTALATLRKGPKSRWISRRSRAYTAP